MKTDGLFDQFQNWFDNFFNHVSAEGTFLVIAIVASALLVISLVLDGIFDWLNFGDGPLSLTTIGAFGGLFGWVGFAAYGFGASVAISSLLGAGVGVAGAVGAFFVSKFFQNSTTTASYDIQDVVGQEAVVSLRILGDSHYGEIAMSLNGHRQTMAALSNTPVAVGQRVRIVSSLSSSSVLVEPVTTNPAPTPAA